MKLRSIAVLLVTICSLPVFGSGHVKRHMGGVADEYVVLLQSDIPKSAFDGVVRSMAATYQLQIETTWPNVVNGFSCKASGVNPDALATDPRVFSVEQNIQGRLAQPDLSGTQGVWYQCPTCASSQYLWFLDRLDQSTWAARDGAYNMCPEGRSVYAYVIDEGIWSGHPEFETPTRVVKNVDFSVDRTASPFSDDVKNGCYDPAYVHGAIHGTAVATSLAGTHIGSSKAKIVSLKTISCDLQWNAQNYLNAIDWIGGPSNPFSGQPAVINHSGFLFSWDSSFQTYSTAVARLVDATNIPYFAAAGNYSTDACQFSPQNNAYTNTNSAGKVFVVGGTNVNGQDGNDGNDYRYQYFRADGTPQIGTDSGSNAGQCVSAYAPAVGIYVGINDRYYSPNYYYTMTGTSFSSPLVAGLAARYIEQTRNQTGVTPTYKQVYDFLLSWANSSPGAVQQAQTAPTYWVCVSAVNGSVTPYDANPGTCGSGMNGPYQMNTATNASNAKVQYWATGACQ